MKKYLVIVVCILILIGGFLVLFNSTSKSTTLVVSKTITPTDQPSSLTPSPTGSNTTDMNNWKTYSDTVYGISFKYPSTWVCPQRNKDITEGYAEEVDCLNAPVGITGNFQGGIGPNFVYRVTTAIPYATVIATEREIINAVIPKGKESTMVVSGITAAVFTYGGTTDVIVNKNNRTTIVFSRYDNPNNPENIFSTITFSQ